MESASGVPARPSSATVPPNVHLAEDAERYTYASDPDTLSDSSGSEASLEQEANVYAPADEEYFPRIVAIFYSIFHPTKGPSVIYQVPEGSVYTSHAEAATETEDEQQQQESQDRGASQPQAHAPLFDFKNLSEYIIPRAPLCGRLITYSITSHGGQSYKILSHPVLLVDQQKYPRNSFIFNLAFVFDGRADVRAYEPIVRKCARELKDLEQNSSFLSRSQFRMYEVIEQLFEDLNSYYESFVALPDAPHTKYVTEAAKAAELLRDKRIFAPKAWQDLTQGASWNLSDSITNDRRAASFRASLRGLAIVSQTNPEAASTGVLKDITPFSVDDEMASLNGAATSPVSPRTVRPAVRRASTDMALKMPVTSATSAADVHGSMLPGHDGSPISPTKLRKDSAGSAGSRPVLGSTKSLAALGLSGTLVTTSNTPTGTLAASTATEHEGAGSRRGSSAQAGPITMSRSSSNKVASHAATNSPGVPPASEEEDGTRELAESFASLRRVVPGSTGDPAASRRASDKTTVGAVAPAAVLGPGKREPPHGLGRTVRDAINVKLFPTYTNPKDVHDWDVPVTLLDLSRRISGNWDLTMRKILPFIDGINHVKRIAQLADADLELTRQGIEHLLYYRCIIMIDLFQFTNMYTVRPTIATLAEDDIIINECASYVTRRGYTLPTWPKLLALYSSLRPSVTLNEWIEDNDIDTIGIDVRRFVTFGVIKGFLRRVHRFPVLLVGEAAMQADRMTAGAASGHQSPRPTGRDSSSSPGQTQTQTGTLRDTSGSRERERVAQVRAEESGLLSPEHGSTADSPISARRGRQETSEEQAWMNVFAPRESGSTGRGFDGKSSSAGRRKVLRGQASLGQLATQRKTRATVMDVANVAFDMAAKERAEHAASSSSTPASARISVRSPLQRGLSSSTIRAGGGSAYGRDSNDEEYHRQPGTTGRGAAQAPCSIKIPAGLLEMLNGTYPDDAFCVRFNRSWNEILRLLVYIGLQRHPTGAPPSTLPNSSSFSISTRRGRSGHLDASTTSEAGQATGEGGDESAFGQMSGIWGVGGTNSAQASRKSSSGVQLAQNVGPSSSAAFPSLPRYRRGSQGQSSTTYQSGFSRYAQPGGNPAPAGLSGAGVAGTTADQTSSVGWSSRAGTSVVMPLADDLGYHDRQRMMRGDLGRVQLIIK